MLSVLFLSQRTRPRSTLPCSIKPPELDPHQQAFTTSVHSSIYPNVKFVLDVNIHEEGIVRVQMDKEDGVGKRYNEVV